MNKVVKFSYENDGILSDETCNLYYELTGDEIDTYLYFVNKNGKVEHHDPNLIKVIEEIGYEKSVVDSAYVKIEEIKENRYIIYENEYENEYGWFSHNEMIIDIIDEDIHIIN